MAVADIAGFLEVDKTLKKSKNSDSTLKGSALPDATSFSDIPPSVDDWDLSYLSTERQSLVKEMLSKFNSMLSSSLGEISTALHHADILPEARPFMAKPYRAGQVARQEAAKQFEEMLSQDFIEPAQFEWPSPAALAPKAYISWRFCIDYRGLISITVKDTYLLPRRDNFVDSLGNDSIFSTLEANSGHWKIPGTKEDEIETTFRCQFETYRFERMLFGLMNAPVTFQRTVHRFLS